MTKECRSSSYTFTLSLDPESPTALSPLQSAKQKRPGSSRLGGVPAQALGASFWPSPKGRRSFLITSNPSCYSLRVSRCLNRLREKPGCHELAPTRKPVTDDAQLSSDPTQLVTPHTRTGEPSKPHTCKGNNTRLDESVPNEPRSLVPEPVSLVIPEPWSRLGHQCCDRKQPPNPLGRPPCHARGHPGRRPVLDP